MQRHLDKDVHCSTANIDNSGDGKCMFIEKGIFK